MYKFQEFYIPERMMGAIDRYVKLGIHPGGFLEAVICNNFSGAVSRADEENMRNLPAYAAYFFNEVPFDCWGSREVMDAWMKEKGGKTWNTT